MNSLNDYKSWREVQRETGIVGDSQPVRQLLETIAQVAPSDISVLVTGESGTGKELVAKAVHTISRRSNESLVTVNCGAIPEGILESELFGHEKGAFTGAAASRKGYFELADNGSIFLDEIGELPLNIQVKLLRVLEQREFMRVGGSETQKVNVRIIAATNRNLEKEVQHGNFRQDLFYRLNAVHLSVPSLRERKQDIPLLVNMFSQNFSEQNLINFDGYTEAALKKMQEYSWPGNVRELRNVVEKMIVLERGQRINENVLEKYIKTEKDYDKNLPVLVNKSKDEAEREFLLRALLEIKSEIAQLRELILSQNPPQYHLPSNSAQQSASSGFSYNPFAGDEQIVMEHDSVSDMEKEMIKNALMKTGHNKRKAAKLLGISERTLYRKINSYGLRQK